MPDTIEGRVRFLSRVPLFHALKDDQLKTIAKRFTEREYKKGTAIVEQGKMGIGLFVIIEGETEVRRMHADGTAVVLNTLSSTDFFGELALLDDVRRSASVVALTDVRCLALRKLDFIDELHDDPEMAIEMLKEMAHRFRRIISHL